MTNDLIKRYSILKGAKYFTKSGSQYYFLFQPLVKYFQASRIPGNAKVMAWASDGLEDKSIKPPTAPSKSLRRTLEYFSHPKLRDFNGNCLTVANVFTPNKVMNLHISFLNKTITILF